jgi:lipid II:glycine glycyltransferase (peptidoglycan interpeptide bridge formation enzyme)
MIVPHSRRAEWDQLVAACPHGDVLQCWEWGELKTRTGWEMLPVAVERAGNLAACAMLLARRMPLVGKSLIYCPRGPIVDFADRELWAELVDEITRAVRRCQGMVLKIDPAVEMGDDVTTPAALRGSGFVASGEGGHFGGVQPRYVMKVDISAPEDDLFASFKNKWRYNIRLAEKRGVEVSRECVRDDVPAFHSLLLETAQRDGFTVRGRSYFEDIWDLLIEAGLARMFMARHEGQLLAATIAFALGRQCWYVYGASSNLHRDVMPNHLIQWEMMRWAKEQGCTIYDMRGVAPEGPGATEEGLSGLNRFKRGFGARYIEYIGEYDLVLKPSWYRLYRLAEEIRTARRRRQDR